MNANQSLAKESLDIPRAAVAAQEEEDVKERTASSRYDPMRVAIVGCGKIADSHVSQIERIANCEIVAVCDREPLMAQQLAERAGVGRSYQDVEKLLKEVQPDVVHLTTPPQSHYPLGRLCLEHGSHVYLEKPFTLTGAEADALIRLAEEKELKITAGHDDQFRHAARRMRKLIAAGYLGGPVVHSESYYCYELSASSHYARALLSDKQHWVRQLPGGLLHNIISHGIARIAEFIQSDAPIVVVHGFTSPALRAAGEEQIIDELRVIIAEENGSTAYFTFSTQMRPSLHQFRVYGPKNGLVLDQDNETLIKLSGHHRKSYLEQLIPPLVFAREYLGNLLHNAKLFAKRDFHSKSGMKFLIESFYEAIRNDSAPPIPYREILLVARIMDSIFEKLK